MKVKKLVLNEFKRFKKLTIDLGDSPKRIVALVGPNGCGKSSVFDAFLAFANCYESIGSRGSWDYHYISLTQSPTYYPQNKISIEFDNGSFDSIRSAKKANGLGNTIFSFRSPYRYNNNLKVQSTIAVQPIQENKYGATYSVDIDTRMEENYRRLYIKYNNYLNENDARPSEAKKHIIDELNGSISQCIDLKIVNLGNIEDNKGTLFFSKKDYGDKTFEYNLLSAGEKEVVDILLDLYLRQDTYNDSVFLIDEPELHINTSIQRKLLLEINKLIGEKCQLWIATHSIGFLRALQEELTDDCQVIEFRDNIPWASSEQLLTPIGKTRADWLRIFSTALDDLTGLVSPKRIIYCEGKDKPGPHLEEKGVDAQVYNNIFGAKYPDTVFVSSGGNTELDQRSDIAISILSKVFYSLEIWVCKDRDMASGVLTSEKDRQEYLKINKPNHRVIKRFEMENYLFDKSVLRKYCKLNDREFNEEKYDACIHDIQNDDVKSLIGVIKVCCGIKGSISPDSFKIELSKLITPDMDVYKELEGCIFEKISVSNSNSST